MATDVTIAAQSGFDTGKADETNPHLFSSANWFGFEAGRALWRTGRLCPIKATMGRGYSVNIETSCTEFKAWWDKHNACVLDRKN